MRAHALSGAATRVGILRACFLVVFLVLAARAAQLSLLDARAARLGAGQIHTALRMAPSRGLIVDRAGVELALTVEAPSIYVLPASLDQTSSTARALARELGLRQALLERRLEGRRGFTFVARWVSRDQARRIEALGLPGVGIVSEPRRAYPGGSLAAQLIGFTNIDGQGVRGIEQQEDGWLRGNPRVVAVERDGGGRLLVRHALAPSDSAGGDIALTIDATMQAAAEEVLQSAIETNGARSASIITLDPRSGEILALAEAPAFDPNHFRRVNYALTRSRAFLDMLEPGSTLKVFLIAGGLEAGVIRASDRVDCSEGKLRVPGGTIRDRKNFGELDVTGVLRVSSNVGAVLIAQRLGAWSHHDTLRRFGFGAATGSGFPVESSGLLRSWREWTPLDQATIAFGQGIGVTPIQLAAATAALANGGTWMRPRLIAARRSPTGRWRPTRPERVRQVVSAETARSVLRMMEDVVGPEGTGRLAGLRRVRVAGKTGTAQKFDPETGAYSRDRHIAWFIGAVPADDPRLAIVVAVDEPAGSVHSGGAVAAPLFAQVAAAQLAALGIMTVPETISAARPHAPRKPAQVASGESRSARSGSTPPAVEMRPVRSTGWEVAARDDERVVLPDFRGLSLSQVREISAQNALELRVHGRGHAVEQDPAPGTILAGSLRRVWVRFAMYSGEG
ncbi:MAG: penicillin-binding protein [Myxococcota bacterium]